MLTDCNYILTNKELDEQRARYFNSKRQLIYKGSFYSACIKRVIDICCSLFALIITFPINLFLAIGTFFTVGRPLLFKQKRVGKDCKIFTVTKFRSMHEKYDKNGVLLPPDQRVSKFGTFIRITSLDELLQFWNIFIGDMSIIGPRPLPTYYLPRYDDRQILRHIVRPGLECPPLNEGYDITVWESKFQNDVDYINRLSLKTDLKMMKNLFKLLFDKKNNSFRKDGHIEEFKFATQSTDQSMKTAQSA